MNSDAARRAVIRALDYDTWSPVVAIAHEALLPYAETRSALDRLLESGHVEVGHSADIGYRLYRLTRAGQLLQRTLLTESAP